MIQLHQDCLLFKTDNGGSIPCSVEVLAIELVGESAAHLDPELVRQAASAVLHYFKHDLGRTTVSVADFSMMLERVLASLGVNIKSASVQDPTAVDAFDLRKLAFDSGKAFELAFFPQLREALRRRLADSPRVLRFRGLRGCVKQILGAKRWSSRCQALNDQIVDYMRQCLSTAAPDLSCGLVVR